MTPTTKKILIFSGFLTATAGTYLIIRTYNKKEGNLLLDYVTNTLHYDNDPQKQAAISTAGNLTDLTKKYPGSVASHTKITPGYTAGDLYASFKKAIGGLGTDTKLFFDTLYKIKNIYTFQLINEIYKRNNGGESLMDAIKGETKLYSIIWNSNSVKYTPVLAYMFGGGANYNPEFTKYINSLPEE